MASNTLTLKNEAASDVVYTLAGTSGSSSQYVQTGSSAAQPKKLTIKNDMKPIGSKGSDRHQILLQHVYLDSLGRPQVVSASVQVTVPRDVVITDAIAKDVMAGVASAFSISGFKDALLDGILP